MNLALWTGIILLLALALVFLLLPIWRFRVRENAEGLEVRKQKNIEVFQQSLQDLEKERADNLISEEEFEKLKTELQRNFLRDMEAFSESGDRKPSVQHKRLLPIAMALLVSVMSLWLYRNWGAGPDVVLPQLVEEIRSAEDQATQDAAFNRLADALQARFDRLPEDIQNGYMLGTMYMELERYEEAVETFDRMLAVMEESPDKATVFGQKAQSQYLAAGQQLTLEVRETMDQALALNPNEQAVMSLLAINALLNEQYAEALAYWKRQLSQLTPGSERARFLEQRIAQLQELIPEAELPPDNQVAANAGSSVEVYVELDESLRAQVNDQMRVFVFVRGTRMPVPLAARNLTVADLPVSLTLDDSDAMMEQFTLSTADTVFVGARISLSGEATAQTGDFQAISDPFPIEDQDETITLVIKDVVQ